MENLENMVDEEPILSAIHGVLSLRLHTLHCLYTSILAISSFDSISSLFVYPEPKGIFVPGLLGNRGTTFLQDSRKPNTKRKFFFLTIPYI